MAAARTTLAALGAVTDDGTVTGRGRSIARIGADPRLARRCWTAPPWWGRGAPPRSWR